MLAHVGSAPRRWAESEEHFALKPQVSHFQLEDFLAWRGETPSRCWCSAESWLMQVSQRGPSISELSRLKEVLTVQERHWVGRAAASTMTYLLWNSDGDVSCVCWADEGSKGQCSESQSGMKSEGFYKVSFNRTLMNQRSVFNILHSGLISTRLSDVSEEEGEELQPSLSCDGNRKLHFHHNPTTFFFGRRRKTEELKLFYGRLPLESRLEPPQIPHAPHHCSDQSETSCSSPPVLWGHQLHMSKKKRGGLVFQTSGFPPCSSQFAPLPAGESPSKPKEGELSCF